METLAAIVITAVAVPLLLLGSIAVVALIAFILAFR
jgi:hypothetical protein